MFAPFGVKVRVEERGVALTREEDGKTYRLEPTEDGFARGTQILAACLRLGLDPYELA